MSKNSDKNKKPNSLNWLKKSNFCNTKTISWKIKSTVAIVKDLSVVSFNLHKLWTKTILKPKSQYKISNSNLKESNVLNFKNRHFILKLNYKLPTEKEKFG